MSIKKVCAMILLLMSIAILAFNCSPSISPIKQYDYFEPVPAVNKSINYPVISCANELPLKSQGLELDMPHITQRAPYIPYSESELCGMTSIAMVSTELGNPREPCQVASYVEMNGLSCCQLTKSSPVTDIARCNKADYLTPVLHRMGIYHLFKAQPLSENEIRVELSNGRPIIVVIAFHRAVDAGASVLSTHAIVIAGFSGNNYLVHNPNREKPDILLYAQLLHGDRESSDWIESYYHFSYRIDGCNPRFRSDCDCPF